MKRKYLLAAGLTSIVALASLTGCKKNNGPQKKFVISISARNYAAEIQMLQLWEKEYEALNPNVNVVVSKWGSEKTSVDYIMNNALDQESMTNMIYTTDDTTAELASKKYFVDLRKYYEADTVTDYTKYYKSMLDLASFYGEFRPTTNYTGDLESEKSNDAQYGLYFAPREYNMPGMLVNVTLLKDSGLITADEYNNWTKGSLETIFKRIAGSETWDWNTFVRVLQILGDKCETLNGSADKGYRGISFNAQWEPVYTTVLKELGGDGLFKVNELGEVIQNLNSDSNKAAYQSIIDSFNGNDNEYVLDSTLTFALKKVFAALCSYPEVANYYANFKQYGYKLDAVSIPCEYVSAGCGGYAMIEPRTRGTQKLVSGETAKTRDLCWDFLKFIISKEGQNVAGKGGYIQPVMPELEEEGDWVQAWDGSINTSAFCGAKELVLDSYCFADPTKRSLLRTDVAVFFQKLFNYKTTSYGSILNEVISSVNKHIK